MEGVGVFFGTPGRRASLKAPCVRKAETQMRGCATWVGFAIIANAHRAALVEGVARSSSVGLEGGERGRASGGRVGAHRVGVAIQELESVSNKVWRYSDRA